MIKKLQRKFILIATLSVFAVMLVIIGGINLANLYSTSNQLDGILALLIDNDGKFPKLSAGSRSETETGQRAGSESTGYKLSEETQFETRYFVVRADENGAVFQLDTGHIAAVSSSGAQKLAEEILISGSESGLSGIYKYRSAKTDYGRIIVFLDCREQLNSLWRVLGVSLAIGAAGLVVIIILITVFSRHAVAPVIESVEKQRRFITDASHEIKTPLTIISANTDVIAYNGGDSEWLASIRNQTERLGGLVADLLTLAKLDEGKTVTVKTDFSLSDAVTETAAPYDTVAQSRGFSLKIEAEPLIGMYGDENGIRRVLSILLDNALKYTADAGSIRVSLKKQGKNARIEVSNTVSNTSDSLPKESLDHLFDRFYRVDTSRSRETGGYGLGLSIAKAIVESHGGSITAAARESMAVFSVLLPLKSRDNK